MKQRNRDVMSQSFSVRPDQIEWLENFSGLATKELGRKIGMSELLRHIIDSYITQYSQKPVTQDSQPHVMPRE